MTSEQNPLLHIGPTVDFEALRPEHAESAISQLLAEAEQRLESLAQKTADKVSTEAFVLELDELTRPLDEARNIVGHMESVMATPEWRAAEAAILPPTTEFYTKLSMHPGLWAAIKSHLPNAGELNAVQRRFLENTAGEFRRGGADLPEDQREQLSAINVQLAELTNQYSKNVLDSTNAFELYVPTERLAGVPERVKAATRADAKKRGKDGHRISLHAPVLGPILTYADDRELRRELYEANGRVGTEEGRDNRPLVRDILRLRREKATLLGYKNFADLVLEPRMAGSGDAALEFSGKLEAQTRAAFEKENAELNEFYRKEAGADAPALELWDLAYWSEKMRQRTYDFDAELLRPYFEMNSVLSGMFEITRRIFGITVKERHVVGWHEDVKHYDIFDEAGTHIANFYTDWFPRDTKRGGAWMNALSYGGLKDGQTVPHLGLMCGNMTPPGKDSPSLLSVDEVETVFHEFGHLLHHALSAVPLRSIGGTNVPWDFVELPSQIMENWVLEREALDLFARHHETGETLPDELYKKLYAARNFQAAGIAMRQYSFGTADLDLHVNFDPTSDEDPIRRARDTMNRFNTLELPEEHAMMARFNHIFSDPVGYAAGYYSYKWAEVLDADAFSRFAKEGIFNRETGRSFVDNVLSKGDSKAPSELYEGFMGRSPDPEALLRRSGLIK